MTDPRPLERAAAFQVLDAAVIAAQADGVTVAADNRVTVSPHVLAHLGLGNVVAWGFERDRTVLDAQGRDLTDYLLTMNLAPELARVRAARSEFTARLLDDVLAVRYWWWNTAWPWCRDWAITVTLGAALITVLALVAAGVGART